AIAVVAYEMLTGDVPFTGETIAMIYVAICQGNFVPPSVLRRGVPPEVDSWFERAFAANPGERFTNARELAGSFCTALLASDSAVRELGFERTTPPGPSLPPFFAEPTADIVPTLEPRASMPGPLEPAAAAMAGALEPAAGPADEEVPLEAA